MNKITSTKVGDDIHFYVNGTEDRGIVVKMNNEYVTVFKESTQAYDDIHINDTFFIKDILVNKEWNKMDDIERYEALKKIHAPSPRFISKAWEDLPKEITELLQKNNAIETSHKEGKDDDMNKTTRIFDKGFGATEGYEEGHQPNNQQKQTQKKNQTHMVMVKEVKQKKKAKDTQEQAALLKVHQQNSQHQVEQHKQNQTDKQNHHWVVMQKSKQQDIVNNKWIKKEK